MDQPPPLQAIATDAYLVAGTVAPSPSIANATPSYGSAPIHPPYAEMIMAAISALKEKDGSSKKAIAKYIERAYPNLPPAHPALLTHHLKRLKNCGQLDMVKKSYILHGTTRSDPAAAASSSSAAADVAASSAAAAAANPLKRRPGRPSKPKAASFDPVAAAVSTKRRGRPPKPKPEPPAAAAAAAAAFDYHQLPVYGAAASAQPLGSNTNTNSPALVNGTTASLAKKRGRPPKYRVGDPVPAVPSASSAVVKRRAGRPPKAAGGGSRPRGRPRKTDVLPPPPPPPATTPRGRPRKRPLLSVDVTALGIKRGRGRPPSALARLPRSTKLRIARTGRPVGRPRKNTSSGGLHASGQSEVAASVELTRKLEYMQLKVKNAVGLLKPHLINANIIDILTAIQDLEELSTMDITAPTTIEIAAAPVAEPIAPTMAHETAPPTDMSAPPLLDLSAPAYPHLGVAGQLPMNFN